MSGASKRLEQSSRAYNYGFDVSKLYEREEKGRKDWRAEVVPTDDEKDRAKAAVVSFKAEFPLGGGTLDGIFEAHRAHVSRLLEHGPRHQRAWYAQRLEMARVAHERLASIRERRQCENRITAVVQQTHRSSRRRPLGPSHKERLRQRHAHARARWCVGSGSRRTSFCRHSVFWRASIVREKVALFLSHLALRESEKPSGEAF